MDGDSGHEKNVEPAEPVLDPGLPSDARAELEQRLVSAAVDRDRAAGCFGALASAISAFGLLLLHFGWGLDLWWLALSALPVTFGLMATRRLGESLTDADAAHVVDPADLDKSARKILLRAQRAIERILDSDVYARHALDNVVEEATLRRHEWEVATALRQISKLRAELAARSKGGLPGPMTAAVLDSHRRALELATDATRSRVRELERYATELEKADVAERDWQAATQASARNDQYLELVARTAADEQAIEEIRSMTEQAAALAQAYREHLYQADLAAQALVLPPAADD
jgi:chemotaxis protein histidine kinase CheA